LLTGWAARRRGPGRLACASAQRRAASFLLPCSAVANQLATSFIVELLVHPVLYAIWKWRFVMRGGAVIPGPAELGHAA
jgi:hypothetical protein